MLALYKPVAECSKVSALQSRLHIERVIPFGNFTVISLEKDELVKYWHGAWYFKKIVIIIVLSIIGATAVIAKTLFCNHRDP